MHIRALLIAACVCLASLAFAPLAQAGPLNHDVCYVDLVPADVASITAPADACDLVAIVPAEVAALSPSGIAEPYSGCMTQSRAETMQAGIGFDPIDPGRCSA